ncbi:hypothetical protein [Jannaschia donghaensis]|nr:hypothetical protein [Jannaschia donghaensis]
MAGCGGAPRRIEGQRYPYGNEETIVTLSSRLGDLIALLVI